MIPTSVAISAAVNEEAARVERATDFLFHVANVLNGFFCNNLGSVEKVRALVKEEKQVVVH